MIANAVVLPAKHMRASRIAHTYYKRTAYVNTSENCFIFIHVPDVDDMTTLT